MAPTPASKSKKGHGASSSRDSHRRSRSRNTTPMSASSLSALDAASTTLHSPYLTTSFNSQLLTVPLSDTPVEDLFEGYGGSASPPSAQTLRTISENIRTNVLNTVKPRGELCERLMRELHHKRKERGERVRMRELEEQARIEREGVERKKSANASAVTPKKRGRDDDGGSSSRPLAVGAHGVAKQDGTDGQTAATSSSISSPVSQPPQSPREAANGNSAPTKEEDPGSPNSEMAEHQPPPAPAVQQYQIFGEDPTAYPDNTIYEIREVTPDMTEEEKKEIFSVAHYPASDLHDQTCGTPPDRDFSNAKPAQQVNFTTFQNYAEPFIRPLTEEDRGFLLERGNREQPFVIPKLGPKHYKEIWAEEDGTLAMDPNAHKLAANEARGTIEDMDDEIASTDMVSVGPALARLMTTMRSEYPFRQKDREREEEEVRLPGIDNMEIDGENATSGAANGASSTEPATQPAASAFPEQYWKGVEVSRPDYAILDDRLHRELIYMGLISPSDTPDYASRLDDEVSARLRYLQTELRRVSIKNGARKARLEELLEDYMSKQEYATIADDLDNQINAAYLKRNRNIGKKGKQTKRPGGAGGGSHVVGVARAAGQGVGVGEPIKGLVERKQRWHDWIGAVVEYGQTRVPKESVFAPDIMKKYEQQELDRFGEESEA